MGYRWRRMYYATGLPGWVRFGYSPGWLGRSPGGLPPIFQYGIVPPIAPTTPLPYPQVPTPTSPTAMVPPMAPMSKEDQIRLLKQQRDMLKKQLEDLERRLAELETK
ncbi:MAG TPA: hypothetical protein EYP68_01755 [Candidatus Korarchaeota archaeon]|nr:hypothetical protein [Candidatus Korarchaeota archaeon]